MSEESTAEVVLDTVEPEIVENPESEQITQESGGVEEQITGDNQDQKQPVFTEDQQRIFNSKMAEEKRAKRDLERQLEEQKQQLAQVQAQLPQETRPDVPALPDRYDFDDDNKYIEAMTARDRLIAEQVSFDERERIRQGQLAQQQHQIQVQAQQDIQTKAKTYSERAEKFGIKVEALQVAGQTVAGYGLSDDIAGFILDNEHGPLITSYLSQNLLDLDALRYMTPMQAAVEISTTIKQKALNLKPKTTNTPEPVESLTGAGAPAKTIGPAGAVYE